MPPGCSFELFTIIYPAWRLSCVPLQQSWGQIAIRPRSVIFRPFFLSPATSSVDATIGFLNGQIIPCIATPTVKQCNRIGLFATIFFFLAGQPFITRLGIQSDEALFAAPVFEPRTVLYSWHIGRFEIPFMLMSYLGCLKTLIYRPIFHLFGAGPYAIREPA